VSNIVVAPQAHGAVVVNRPGEMLMSPSEAKRRYEETRAFVASVMVRGVDYGTIPGTGDKPTLLKPGAERLIELYGYQPEFEFVERTENWGDDGRAPFLYYIVRCRLIHRESGIQVASGIGSCNTRESKYAYRWVWARDIPEGVSPKTLRQRTTRKGQGDPQYALPNTEIGDLANTVLKMAQKRAMIAAVLVACRVGGMFQQDLEDAPDAELLGEEEATRPWERAEAAASASVVERLITAMRSAVVGKDPKEALAALKLEAGSHARERLSKDERDQVAAAYREITAELKAAMPTDKGSDPGTAAPAPAAETVNPTTGEVST
jgi:hypothetical protein